MVCSRSNVKSNIFYSTRKFAIFCCTGCVQKYPIAKKSCTSLSMFILVVILDHPRAKSSLSPLLTHTKKKKKGLGSQLILDIFNITI